MQSAVFSADPCPTSHSLLAPSPALVWVPLLLLGSAKLPHPASHFATQPSSLPCNTASWGHCFGRGKRPRGCHSESTTGRRMHAAVDRRKAVMLRIESALSFDSCCGKPDAFNPETTLSTDTPDFYSVQTRPSQRAFRWSLSWLSITGGSLVNVVQGGSFVMQCSL